MFSQLNPHTFILFHPSMFQKPLSPHNPSSISLKVRSFRTSYSTPLPNSSPLSSVHFSRSSKRVSRVLKTEVQHVLMDYLHSTRGYSFSDAEYISKNSPRFVESLVSNIEGKDDVSRSLRKFLRYNPINEFEPFFESIGINPFEFPLVLPSGMIYLADDHFLIENFHVLSNYGIPRNRMGKIYKEAKDVFGYASGILLSKLQAYENLGLSRSTVVKFVVCCPSLLVGDVNCEFVGVLDWFKRIEIENDWIGNYLSCSRTYSWKRMLDSLQFLHKVGYSEDHIKSSFKADPKLLLDGFGKSLYLFLGQSFKLGLDMNVIYSYFTEYPYIFSNKFAKNLLRAVRFLYLIEMGTDEIAHILSDYMHLLSKHSLKGHKTVCKELKVGKADLCQIIKDDPMKLFSLASKLEQENAEVFCHDPHKHLEKTTFLLKLGYMENSEEMGNALKMFRGRGDQLQERFDCLVEAGLDYNSVIDMIKRAPMILNQKRSVIEKKIEFLRNVLGYPVECVVGFPTYFYHDLDKIIERFTMYAWLKERNAVNPTYTLSTIVSSNEKRFVKYFVNMHPQGPAIWKGLKKYQTNIRSKD